MIKTLFNWRPPVYVSAECAHKFESVLLALLANKSKWTTQRKTEGFSELEGMCVWLISRNCVTPTRIFKWLRVSGLWREDYVLIDFILNSFDKVDLFQIETSWFMIGWSAAEFARSIVGARFSQLENSILSWNSWNVRSLITKSQLCCVSWTITSHFVSKTKLQVKSTYIRKIIWNRFGNALKWHKIKMFFEGKICSPRERLS